MYSVLCRRFSHLQRTLSLVNPVVPVAEPSSSFFLNGSGLTRWVSTSPCLFAEPLKKKKRLDPAIIKAREDRRKRKLEKQIRRMEKTAKQLKPLQELEVPVSIVDTYYERLRQEIKISPEEEESRWLLQKDWARYMFRVNSAELRMIDRILASQQKALEELRKESEELYQAAIQVDFSYIPCEIKGNVETPPIKDFEAAQGDFHDISKKWN